VDAPFCVLVNGGWGLSDSGAVVFLYFQTYFFGAYLGA
jgi:hypothetical protein